MDWVGKRQYKMSGTGNLNYNGEPMIPSNYRLGGATTAYSGKMVAAVGVDPEHKDCWSRDEIVDYQKNVQKHLAATTDKFRQLWEDLQKNGLPIEFDSRFDEILRAQRYTELMLDCVTQKVEDIQEARKEVDNRSPEELSKAKKRRYRKQKTKEWYKGQ